jgi:hypothetical protein
MRADLQFIPKPENGMGLKVTIPLRKRSLAAGVSAISPWWAWSATRFMPEVKFARDRAGKVTGWSRVEIV